MECPEWLYFVAIAPSVPRYSRGDSPGIHVHDWIPEIAQANASTLHTLALTSKVKGKRGTGEFGVLARPRGQSATMRTNPDNPRNRTALLKLLDRGMLSPAGVLWYVPGWVLDAFLEPQRVSLPSWSTTFVEVWGYRRGAPFVFGSRDAARTVIQRRIPEGSRAQVLIVASSTLAPRIIRPGTVLDAYYVEQRGMAGLVQVRGNDSESLAQMYVGRMISQFADHADRHPLPGEPVKDLVEFVDGSGIIKLPEKRAEESRGTPGLAPPSEAGDSADEPPFTKRETMTGPSGRKSHELVVFEQIGRETGLRGEEVRP